MTLWTERTTVTVEVALTSQPDDPFPQWTDISPYVQVGGRGGPISVGNGRQTELSQSQPGTLALALRNGDKRFTPGNVTSPYYPYFKQARKIRVRETIGYRTFDIFTGYLEIPEVAVYDGDQDQIVNVTAVDRLTRLDRGRRFISTLTEYIRYTGGSALQAYYPLLEANGMIAYDKSRYGREPLTLTIGRNANVGSPIQVDPVYAAGAGTTLPGDDLAGPVWQPRTDANGKAAEEASLQATWSNPVTLSGTDTITLAAWVNLKAAPLPSGDSMVPLALYDPTFSEMSFFTFGSSFGWQADGSTGTTAAASITCPDLPAGSPMLVAVRMTLSSGLLEVWRHNDTPASTTLTAPVATTAAWNQIVIGDAAWAGSITHVQVYLGGPTAYTRAQHLAQIQAGFNGLAGQTTGQRIRTIAAYAGIPAGELRIDDGTVQMPNTSLAGKNPLAPMREAETTEQGRLAADGAGRLVFRDRARRYNI